MENLKYSEILKLNVSFAKDLDNLPSYKIKILSNITCNQLKDVLTFNLLSSKINTDIKLGNYDNIIQDSYTCNDEHLVIIHYDLLNIIDKDFYFIEGLTKEQLNTLYNSITSDIDLVLSNLKLVPAIVFDTFTSASIHTNAVLSTKTDLLVKKLNEFLFQRNDTNLQVLDINVPLSKVGISNAFDFRMFYLSKNLYTISFWKEYTYALSTLIYRINGKLKKAIIFDCDDTLWKGIIGEDGITGIDISAHSKIGQIFNKIQQIAKWLSSQGIIIGICSKNNPADVEIVFKEHADMRLTKDDIVISKVNWSDKASNLREISKELNIGLDSIIFIDDSPFEVNLIREQLPDIFTMQVPTSLQEYPNQLLRLVERYFYLSGNSSDIDKTRQYKSQNQRTEEKGKHNSLEEYLASLEMEITIQENNQAHIERITQLTQKTNQFNLTTQRYTENQIDLLMNKVNNYIFSVFVKDKFGESGLTALCIISSKNEVATLDTFLISCRIMGRNIELAFLDYIIYALNQKGLREIEAFYIPTLKNEHVSNFYNKSGFHIIKNDKELKHYKVKVSDYKNHNIGYIKINH
jgi:FkbH-like protein